MIFPLQHHTVIRKEVMDTKPTIPPLLNALSAKIDHATMRKLNSSLDVNKNTIEEVATKFLNDPGML